MKRGETMNPNHRPDSYGQILIAEAYLVPYVVGRANETVPTSREEMRLWNEQLKSWGFPFKIVHGDHLVQLEVYNDEFKDWCIYGAPTEVVHYFFGDKSLKKPFPTIFPAREFVGKREGELINFDLQPSYEKCVSLFLVLGQSKSRYGTYGKFESILNKIIMNK